MPDSSSRSSSSIPLYKRRPANPVQREKDSGGRAPVLGLEEKDARRASRHLRLRLLMMLSRYDDHSMTRKRNPVRAIHGVLQERPCPDERAVLFGPGRAQLALDEITRSASFSTGEDDRPQAVLARLQPANSPQELAAAAVVALIGTSFVTGFASVKLARAI